MKPSEMKISDKGVNFIKRYEGLRLNAYEDIAGVWTIGYGHTRTAKEGMKISESQAEKLLRSDIENHEWAVQRFVKVDLTQDQYDALASFVFNLGTGAFNGSTLLWFLNDGRYNEAAKEFHNWCKSGRDVIPGLQRRRAEEMMMFHSFD
jgi:lysozyme